jgi:hypothetical protein
MTIMSLSLSRLTWTQFVSWLIVAMRHVLFFESEVLVTSSPNEFRESAVLRTRY